jgi:hypothetical protein
VAVSWTSRTLLASAVAGIGAACGANSPSPAPPLALVPGTYTIATTLDPTWCATTGRAPESALSLRAVPEQRDLEWVFRLPDQPESTFELWVHRTAADDGPIQIHGFIRGKATISASPVVTADFGKLGLIAGTTDLQHASGAITGQVIFADTAGNALTCTNLRWSFARMN